MKTARAFLGIGVILLSAPLWGRAQEISAEDILKKVSETYSRLQGYRLVAASTYHVNAWPSLEQLGALSYSAEGRISLAVAKPGKVRLTVKGEEGEIVLASNGEFTWSYLPKRGEYSKEEAAISTEWQTAQSLDEEYATWGAFANVPARANQYGGLSWESKSSRGDVMTRALGLLLARYVGLPRYSASVALGREDRVEVGGKKVPCYRITIRTNAGEHQLWIDKANFLVVRHNTTYQAPARTRYGTRTLRTEITLALQEADPSVPPDSFFDFTLPKQARQLAALDLPAEQVKGVGERAADFSFKDPQRGLVSLSDLRGKVVLLYFWASWCGPCRKQMGTVEKLGQQFKDKHVVALGITEEDAGTATSFIQNNGYSLQVVKDTDRAVHRQYGVRALPTVVVVDGGGVVVARRVGTGSEEELLAALKAAGVT